MEFKAVQLKIENHVAWLVMNRPEMKNALNAASAGRKLILVKNRHGRNVKAILHRATDRRLITA